MTILKELTIIPLIIFTFSVSASIKPVTNFCSQIQGTDKTTLSEYLDQYKEKMNTKTGVYVLEKGAESLISRAWLSDKAEKTIDVQYFIFSADNIGLIAADYLIKAAERGVKVRILVDDLMIDADGHELLKLSAHKNLSIKIYNPNANIGKHFGQKLFNLITDFHGFNQRMHNKTFTVDGKIAITGGRNVADEYFGYDHEYNFRDRDVLLIGGETKSISNSFELFWNDSLSVPVQKLVKNRETFDVNYSALHEYACNPDNFVPQVRKRINEAPILFRQQESTGKIKWIDNVEYITDVPGKNNEGDFLGGGGISTRKLIELAKSANSSLVIQTPYLITTSVSENLFKALIDKGVDIKVLTNSLASNDNLEAFSGYQRVRNKLLKIGVKIYEFKPNAKIRQKVMSQVMEKKLDKMPIFGLHSKSMVIDNDITVIGTFNLDPRSANLNTESITIIPSKSISLSVKRGMLEEMKIENAWQTTLDWNPDGEASFIKRLRVKLRRFVPKSIL